MPGTNGTALTPIPKHPWDQQPGETIKAFKAFLTYRDAEGRTVSKTATALGYTSPRTCQEWSAKHNWIERAAAYDRHLAEVATKATENEVRNMAKRHARQAIALQSLGEQEIQRAAQEGQKLHPSDASRLIATGITIERDTKQMLDQDPMAKLREFEHLVLEAIEQESPEVAGRIRAALTELALTNGAY